MPEEIKQYVVSGRGISATICPDEDSANAYVTELSLTKPWVEATVTEASAYAEAEKNKGSDESAAAVSTSGTD